MIKLLIVLLSFLQFSYGHCASLHMILVGDTQSNLSHQVVQDIEFMKGRGNALANELGIPCVLSVFTGPNANGHSILSFIDSKPFDTSDIVIFYFTGHGYRTPKKSSKWPYLLFTVENQPIALDEIVNKLYQINPQFSLVIADCCNNYLDHKTPFADPSTFNFFRSKYPCFHPCSVELFKKSRGVLVISGAEPGGYSWTNNEGGILTGALFDALGFCPSNDWNHLINQLQQQTRHIQKIQSDHYSH